MSPAALMFDPAKRAASLALANETRSLRSTMKRAIRAGEVDGLELLAAPPAWLGSMLVIQFLDLFPRFGPVQSAQAMNRCGLRHLKTLGSLTDRQRGVLVAQLREGRSERSPNAT